MENHYLKISSRFLFFISVFIFINYDTGLFAQAENSRVYSLKECLEIAFKNNEQMSVAQLETDYYRQVKKTAYEIPKTSLVYTQGQFNSIYPYDNIFTISQTLPFPTYIMSQSNLGKLQIKSSDTKMDAVKADLALRVKEAYYNLEHLLQEIRLIHAEDSIYDLFLESARATLSETDQNKLGEATTLNQAYLIQSDYFETQQQLNESRNVLQSLMRIPESPRIVVLRGDERILVPDTNSQNIVNQPHLLYLKEQIEIQKQLKRVEKQKVIPDIMLSYFNQSIYGPANIYGSDYFLTRANRLNGFQVGVAFPLFFYPHQARVKANGIQEKIATENFLYTQNEMKTQMKQAVNKYLISKTNLDYYKEFVLKNSRLMLSEALFAFNKKEINYIDYLNIVSKAMQVESNYLLFILHNNISVIQIDYYLSN